MSKYYPGSYYIPKNLSARLAKPYSMLMEKRKAAGISKYKKSGRILDVGCGAGDFLSVFDVKKWERFGLDISKEACTVAGKKLGKNIFHGELANCQFPNKYFDVITLNHVLEHMARPREEMNKIFRVLKDDGILFIRIPNIESTQFRITREFWLHLDVPRHIYFYSEKTARLLLEESGFRVIRVSYLWLEYPLDFFHSIDRKYNGQSTSKIKNTSIYLFAPFALFIKLLPKMRGTCQLIASKR